MVMANGQPEEQPSAADEMRQAGAAGFAGFDEPAPAATPPPPRMEPAPAAAPSSIAKADLESSDRYYRIPISAIFTDPDKFQRRDVDPAGYSEQAVADLVAKWDRREADPIKVTEFPVGSGRYVVIAGHHRLAAATQVGQPDIDAEILGLDIGNPDTKEGRDALLAFAVKSNFRDRSQTLQEKITAFRTLRGLDSFKSLTDEQLIQRELPSIEKTERNLIKGMTHLPDRIITEVSQQSALGDRRLEPYAQALGEYTKRAGWSEEFPNRFWQTLITDRDASEKLELVPKEAWRLFLSKAAETEVGEQGDLFGPTADLRAILDQFRDEKTAARRRQRTINEIESALEECITKSRETGVDTGQLEQVLRARLKHAQDMQAWERQRFLAATKDQDPAIVGPPPPLPDILRGMAAPTATPEPEPAVPTPEPAEAEVTVEVEVETPDDQTPAEAAATEAAARQAAEDAAKEIGESILPPSPEPVTVTPVEPPPPDDEFGIAEAEQPAPDLSPPTETDEGITPTGHEAIIAQWQASIPAQVTNFGEYVQDTMARLAIAQQDALKRGDVKSARNWGDQIRQLETDPLSVLDAQMSEIRDELDNDAPRPRRREILERQLARLADVRATAPGVTPPPFDRGAAMAGALRGLPTLEQRGAAQAALRQAVEQTTRAEQAARAAAASADRAESVLEEVAQGQASDAAARAAIADTLRKTQQALREQEAAEEAQRVIGFTPDVCPTPERTRRRRQTTPPKGKGKGKTKSTRQDKTWWPGMDVRMVIR